MCKSVSERQCYCTEGQSSVFVCARLLLISLQTLIARQLIVTHTHFSIITLPFCHEEKANLFV